MSYALFESMIGPYIQKLKCQLVVYINERIGGADPGGGGSADYTELFGLGDPYTLPEARALVNPASKVLYIKDGGVDKFAVFKTGDTTSADNGTTIIVDSSTPARRYRLMTGKEFFQQVITAVNIFDVV